MLRPKVQELIDYFKPGRIAQFVECPKCGSADVHGKEGERCCLSCGAHQTPPTEDGETHG